MLQFIHTRCLDLQIHNRYVIIQHLLELLMIQSDKLAYLTDLSGSRGRTSVIGMHRQAINVYGQNRAGRCEIK